MWTFYMLPICAIIYNTLYINWSLTLLRLILDLFWCHYSKKKFNKNSFGHLRNGRANCWSMKLHIIQLGTQTINTITSQHWFPFNFQLMLWNHSISWGKNISEVLFFMRPLSIPKMCVLQKKIHIIWNCHITGSSHLNLWPS